MDKPKTFPLYQRALGFIAYVGAWCLIIYVAKLLILRAVLPAPEVDIRDLSGPEYQAALEKMIVKAKSASKRERFEQCMNINYRAGEKAIMDCLAKIPE